MYLLTTLSQLQPQLQASTWVKVLEQPNSFSFHEALLLCQESEEYWVAWIPNHGEIKLHIRQIGTIEE